MTNINEDGLLQIVAGDAHAVTGLDEQALERGDRALGGNAALQYRQVFVVTVKIKCIAVKMEYSDVFHFFSSSSILPSLPKADAARI